MGHETCINRRSALKGFDVYLDQIGSAGGVRCPREREVMGLMVAGLLNKQIAAELGTALATIKIQRASVMKKMRARSVGDLVRMSDKVRTDTGGLEARG